MMYCSIEPLKAVLMGTHVTEAILAPSHAMTLSACSASMLSTVSPGARPSPRRAAAVRLA